MKLSLSPTGTLRIVPAMWSRSETTTRRFVYHIATPAMMGKFGEGYHVSKLLSKHNEKGGETEWVIMHLVCERVE